MAPCYNHHVVGGGSEQVISVAELDRRLRRAGLDYWQSLDWAVVDDWDALVRQLGERRRWFLTKKATRVYAGARFEPGDVLVFGSESRGLPATMLAGHGEQCLRIPIRPEARATPR